jgi:NADH-quinone oxidoreductase subunit A
MFIVEFLNIIVFIILSFLLSGFFLFLGLKLSPKAIDFEKVSAYECGFIPVGDARQPFHVRFYLIGVLFLLFDLEVIYLIPWAITFHSVNHTCFAFVSILTFVLLLTLGLFYE